MGKNTDKLYITHSEWSSSDAYSASAGAGVSARGARTSAPFKRLPFNYCAASLQPFKDPVCTADGTIFDAAAIAAWQAKHGATNPVTGAPLDAARDLVRLRFARNGDGGPAGNLVDPVTFKVFTDHTHIVAVRHGDYANVFAWDTVERMNVKARAWRDLVDDQPFERADIITLQDPRDAAARDTAAFQHLRDGGEAVITSEQEEARREGGVNVAALGRMGEKVLKAREAVARARTAREAGGDVNKPGGRALVKAAVGAAARHSMVKDKKLAHNAAIYTTGRAAASFTSTGLTPETSGERAVLSDEEWMLKPKRIKIKGFARIETNLGDLTIELQTDTAPKAVWNFVKLAQKGYYKDVDFHRNIKNFMIQGGDPTGTGKGGTSIWGKPFGDEFEGPLTHGARGMVSMANKGKNTNSSQFFVTYRAAKHLDHKHTIFGRIVDGLPVLDRLEAVPTGDGDRPLERVYIKDVVVFLDPFEEFLHEKDRADRLDEDREEVRRRGGTEDDKVTWTGKRIRDDGGIECEDGLGGVGKYLKAVVTNGQGADSADKDVPVDASWEAPSRKKVKTGGFGNFDNW
ncbi:hypothetical protein P8C59_006842 [Phyllachora maydis]|uniref:Peptidyl-prolyl cis-trans isomerase-like 2 n=1 Tax=Phyllachora maydis TaxID=1825666 RepID=A0AAD9I909_9PEZI|nr:hypothetical protein P8C59_006842 [Phyllachora maydis]